MGLGFSLRIQFLNPLSKKCIRAFECLDMRKWALNDKYAQTAFYKYLVHKVFCNAVVSNKKVVE